MKNSGIKVICCLVTAIYLVHCHPLHMNDISRRSLVCNRQTSNFTLNCGERSKHLEDISQFNDEFQTFNQIIHDNQTVNKSLIVNCI